MRVLFHYEVGEQLDRYLRQHAGAEIDLVYCRQDDTARFADEMKSADILWHVLQPVTRAQIERATNLKLIQKIGVGVNTIDLEAARSANIAVCNMPGTNSRAVAEMTLMLMLAALRLQPRLDRLCRSGQWHPTQITAESLGEIGGRTVGLIGFGNIANTLAPVLAAMGATVIYSSRAPKDVPFECVELDTLLQQSDIVSLHIPLTPDTDQFINAQRLKQMKKRAILINTARGGLVDERALYQALSSGHLHAAGIDVFATEPTPPDNPLLKLDNLVAAPHVAWLTQETWQRSLHTALQNIEAIRTGTPLQHRVV